MPFVSSKMGDETQDSTSLAVNIPQLSPFANRMKQQHESEPAPTHIETGDSGVGYDLVLTTYVTVTKDSGIENVETAIGPAPPHTVTVTTGLEQATVTVSAILSNMATLMASGTQVPGTLTRTVTATVTVTAIPPGQVCTTIGTAVGVPIASGVAAFFVIGGMYLWLIVRRKRCNDERHSVTPTIRFALTDSDSPSGPGPGPAPCGRRRGGGDGSGDGSGGDSGNDHLDTPSAGILAPPSSLASQPDGPLADGGIGPRYNQTPLHAVQRGFVRDGGGPGAVQSQRASYVSIQSTIPESEDSSIDGYEGGAELAGTLPARSNSIATVLSATANGEPRRPGRVQVPMDDGEVVTFEDDTHGAGLTRFPSRLRTVIYVPPANGSGETGPVIRSVQTAPLRPIEIVRSSQDALRASTSEHQVPASPRALAFVPAAEEHVVVAELEGSPVPRRFLSEAGAKSQGSASSDSSKRTVDDPQPTGKLGPFELSADNPILELGTDGAIPMPKTNGAVGGSSREAVDTQTHGRNAPFALSAGSPTLEGGIDCVIPVQKADRSDDQNDGAMIGERV